MSQRRARLERQRQDAASPSSSRGRRRSPRLWAGLGAAALVAALVGGVLAARGNGPAQPVAVHVSGKQVEFSGTDVVTSRPVDLASYSGKPVVVNVWFSTCPGCQQEARDLAAFEAAHREAQVVGVDFQDSKGAARAFYREFGWSHPSVFDPQGKIAFGLGVNGFPTTLFLDRRHRLVTEIVGASNRAGFERGLEAAKRVS
jgi:thiol-disulfide isomerase/thioredoxin